MKKYDVYALGNALVDSEFEVDDSLLSVMQISKRQMTLIDAERKAEYLTYLGDRPFRRTGGGSAGNTVTAIAQLGGKCFFSCRLGNDENGQFYVGDLTENAVTHRIDLPSSTGETGACLVLVTPDAERSMATYLGITASLSVKDIHVDDLIQSKMYFMEGYLSSSPVSLEASITAKKIAKNHGLSLSLTLSDVSMVQYFRSALEAMMGDDLDYLFCNEEEAKCWTGQSDFADICDQMRSCAKCLCITRGAKGCVILHDGDMVIVDGFPVKALDTNGAGDMFAGTFLYAVSQELDVIIAGKLANATAARVVSQHGNRLTKNILQDIKKSILT